MYGSEDTLSIDPSVIQAVKAKQAVVEWQIHHEDGITRNDRQEHLLPVEEAYKRYLVTCKGMAMPPRLSYPERPTCLIPEDVISQNCIPYTGQGQFMPVNQWKTVPTKRHLKARRPIKAPAPRQIIQASGGSRIREEISEEQIEAAAILMELKYGMFWPTDVASRPQTIVGS